MTSSFITPTSFIPPPTSCEYRYLAISRRRSSSPSVINTPPTRPPLNTTTTMATFRPVNTTLAQESHGRSGEETNPTTPRPNTAPSIQPQPMTRDDATTPTRANFGALASQRPLPATSISADIPVQAVNEPQQQPRTRPNSQYSTTSTKSQESGDVDMDDSDNGEDGSDEESVNADGTRTKKKKSQRFYCTDYPPCSLSFTRSEHLARHIR